MNIKTTSPFKTSLTDDNFYNAQGNYVNTVVANKVAWGIPVYIYPYTKDFGVWV